VHRGSPTRCPGLGGEWCCNTAPASAEAPPSGGLVAYGLRDRHVIRGASGDLCVQETCTYKYLNQASPSSRGAPDRPPQRPAVGPEPRHGRPHAGLSQDAANVSSQRQIRRLVISVDLVGSGRIWPAQVGWTVGRVGSRRVQSDRLDDQRDDQVPYKPRAVDSIATRWSFGMGNRRWLSKFDTDRQAGRYVLEAVVSVFASRPKNIAWRM
jgi:hypothetical protein